MKKIAFILCCTATFAHAQQSHVSIEEIQANYLIETGQLRQALGQSQAELIKLRKENIELKAKQAPKPETTK